MRACGWMHDFLETNLVATTSVDGVEMTMEYEAKESRGPHGNQSRGVNVAALMESAIPKTVEPTGEELVGTHWQAGNVSVDKSEGNREGDAAGPAEKGVEASSRL